VSVRKFKKGPQGAASVDHFIGMALEEIASKARS
jgi:hypothetical protein